MLLNWQWNEVLFEQSTEGYPKRRCQPHPLRSFTITNEKTRGRTRFETLRSGAGFSPSWSSCAPRSMVFYRSGVGCVAGYKGARREGDTWSRGSRFVSTIRTGSVGLNGICDECIWTFYPTQVYLDVRCFLVTVEPYTRIVEVKSSPSPLNTLNERKSALASGGSIAAAREEERESTGECLRPNLFSPRSLHLLSINGHQHQYQPSQPYLLVLTIRHSVCQGANLSASWGIVPWSRIGSVRPRTPSTTTTIRITRPFDNVTSTSDPLTWTTQ